MIDPVERAFTHLRTLCPPGTGQALFPITINFHPDLGANRGRVIELMVRDGYYRSQFETGTSSGGLTAFRGGDRWNWESRAFGDAYGDEHASLRPKYGALNYRKDPVGASRRFGSCHLRLAPHVGNRVSYCYPDSYWSPDDFAVDDVTALIALASSNARNLDPALDNYIEAHVHGELSIGRDVEAVVLDPSFRATDIERAANGLPCDVEWHDGFSLSTTLLDECAAFRGKDIAEAITRAAEGGVLTPAILWRIRDRLDYQTAKLIWHCIARFGVA
jgi:hypothetical protein